MSELNFANLKCTIQLHSSHCQPHCGTARGGHFWRDKDVVAGKLVRFSSRAKIIESVADKLHDIFHKCKKTVSVLCFNGFVMSNEIYYFHNKNQ